MQAIIKHARSVKHGVQTAHAVFTDPISFIFDRLIVVIITTFIPIPYIGELAAVFKKQILALLAGIILIPIAVALMVVSMVTNSRLLANPSALLGGNSTSALSIDALDGYIEDGFTNTDIPQRNPLGGNGFTNAIITFDYHQAGYGFFDGVHEGIDLYPSRTYFQTNKAYLKTGQIIVFATLNGTGDYYVDQYGSNTVEIVNKEDSLKTINMHLAVSFISTGQHIQAGQPIGIMGATGEATGVHLHYQIDLNDSGTWTPTDPKQYIQ